MTIEELNNKIKSGEVTELRYVHHQYGEVDYFGSVMNPGVYYINDVCTLVTE
jgi:hypothetical protein